MLWTYKTPPLTPPWQGPLQGLALVAMFCLGSCVDADDLGAGTAARFCGDVVGNDVDGNGECQSNCSFIRRGFQIGTVLQLAFFPESDGCDLIEAPANWAGVLSTSDGALDCVFFQSIEPLEHDLLSLYEFPGPERLRNDIFTLRPTDGALQDRDVMLFSSFTDEERLELRLIAGSGDEAQGDYFGLFLMEKSNGTCLP